MQFRELSYANDTQSRITQWLIRSIEGLSGRDHYVRLYNAWRTDIVPAGIDVFRRMMDLINIRLDVADQWPPQHLPDTPLVIVANHPFGIGDGIAALALAEQLGRPFRVLINNDLMKVPEIRPYALPVCFDETKEAVAMNMATRHEAVRLLKEGVTIVVFPAGGVATAPKGFGRAEDLPWEIVPAQLAQQAKAAGLPAAFGGGNGRGAGAVGGDSKLWCSWAGCLGGGWVSFWWLWKRRQREWLGGVMGGTTRFWIGQRGREETPPPPLK